MKDEQQPARILLVDDVPGNIKVAGSILRREGYKVVFATNGREALERVADGGFDLILLDIMMPDMDGYEVCQILKRDDATKDTPVIFLTAKMDTESILQAYRTGGQDFVSKPFNESELLARIGAHLDLKRSHERLRSLNTALEHEVSERKKAEKKLRAAQEEIRQANTVLEERVMERTARLSEMIDEVISTMARLVEIRDPYTAGHQQRVSDLAVAIAEKMALPLDEIDGIRAAGIVHDIGKMYVPGEILTRPGRLEDYEFKLLQAHAAKGAWILHSIDFPWPVANLVRQHHERLDGTGYPDGLRDRDILRGAKILAVADVVEAISSHRPYRPSLGIEAALEEIEKNSGSHFDPEVVETCCQLFREKEFSFIYET